MQLPSPYVQASIKTADNLRTIAQSALIRDLSCLSLPQINQVVEQVAHMLPAGNVPGVILNGLARLPERHLPPERTKRDLHMLFAGVESFLDKAMYTTLFAGPAAVIWGYQNLLKLAGKDPQDAFPDGTWQFYIEYALRDDTARHTNESHGFQTALDHYRIPLSPADRLAAWTMAAIYTLNQYPHLLNNEWRERTYLSLLKDIATGTPFAAQFTKISREWDNKRPYGRGAEAGAMDYPTYRQDLFDRFLRQASRDLPDDLREIWQRRILEKEQSELPAYQQQMSILATLEPGPYNEERVPIPLQDARIGIIYQGIYWLVPANQPDPEQVRATAAAILAARRETVDPLTVVAGIRRAALPGLLKKLSAPLRGSIDALRSAPILINIDGLQAQSHPARPLARTRQVERGIGSHPITILDLGKTIAFDQSHIFFDGTWGAALAEIMTNEALSWAVYFHQTPASPAHPVFQTVTPRYQRGDQELLNTAPKVTAEACAENESANLKAILALRKLFKQRSDLIQLTVNDLLILFRAFHAATYQPNPEIVLELQALSTRPDTSEAGKAALAALAGARDNPAVLIPIDASQNAPRERLYPLNFEVPLSELDLVGLHQRCLVALDDYRREQSERSAAYQSFDQLQRRYLATLAGFGSVLSKAKEIALRGESASVGTIKMLAYMPPSLQRMLDEIPGRVDVLNDLVKGREVYSNVGAVAPGSTLVRFITAKDDNEKKTLAWGVLTDASGIMRISLRDFRSHVGLLFAAGCGRIADRLAQDYLDAYVRGLNLFVRELQRITMASRETRLVNRGE